MKYEDSKRVKRIRLALCTFFVIISACISLPFYLVIDGTRAKAVTDVELIMQSFMNGEIWAGLFFLLFLLIPAAGFFIAVFDRKSRFKAAAGLVCSALGIISILFFITPANISFGSMLSLLLYIVTFLISMYLLLIKTGELHQFKEQEQEQANKNEDRLVIKLDKNGTATAQKTQEDKQGEEQQQP